jgi:hypothetical protein
MKNIEQVRKAAQEYFDEQCNILVDQVIKSNDFSTRKATCDARHWDNKLHSFMPKIAQEMRNRGFTVTSKINWGVTDWTITVEPE